MAEAAQPTPSPVPDRVQGKDPEGSYTRIALLEAAAACLTRHGYAGVTTRRVAEEAGVPLSQIHYHFGSKQGLMLGILKHQNEKLLERQSRTFSEGLPLWRRWELACDYLEQDLASGYVRTLQEMSAAGWAEPKIAAEVRRIFKGWFELIRNLTREAEGLMEGLGPFSVEDIATLIGVQFMGAEAAILLGFEEAGYPVQSALRKFGAIIRALEENA